MVTDLAKPPTQDKELVSGNNHYTGYCDACADRAGGVWLSGNLNLQPIVWRVHFPPAISSQVVSEANPGGQLTNLDLEMAAVLLHYMLLQQEVDIRFIWTGIWSDNTPTVAWTRHMANRLQAPMAGWLLLCLAAIQTAKQAGPLTIGSIAGIENDMAKVASRNFSKTLLCDCAFLTHFTNRFPLPQRQSWRLAHLISERTLLMT
jgi:hypothetical protein